MPTGKNVLLSLMKFVNKLLINLSDQTPKWKASKGYFTILMNWLGITINCLVKFGLIISSKK